MTWVLRWGLRLLGLLVVTALVAGAVYRWRRPRLPPPPTRAELDALVARRNALQEQVLDLTVRKDDQGLARAPRGSIMIGVPTGFTRAIVEQVVTGLFRETTLTLRNLKVHKEGEVKVKALVKKRKIGEYVLDVQIQEVSGLLKPGKPEMTFGHDRIGLKLPVSLAEGTGRATLHVGWDSKGLAANAICGDTNIDRPVTGTVVPADYLVEGGFGVAAGGDTVVLTPDFGELTIKVTVRATDESWKVVDEVIAAQRAGCEMALNKADLKGILSRLLGKGFDVKIPRKIFQPLRLPAGVTSSLKLQGVDLAFQVRPTGLVVTPDRIWYGADLKAGKSVVVPPPPTAKPVKGAGRAPAPKRSAPAAASPGPKP
jgi:hypothetical protein